MRTIALLLSLLEGTRVRIGVASSTLYVVPKACENTPKTGGIETTSESRNRPLVVHYVGT